MQMFVFFVAKPRIVCALSALQRSRRSAIAVTVLVALGDVHGHLANVVVVLVPLGDVHGDVAGALVVVVSGVVLSDGSSGRTQIGRCIAPNKFFFCS